jgi:hypothetical protein
MKYCVYGPTQNVLEEILFWIESAGNHQFHMKLKFTFILSVKTVPYIKNICMSLNI